MYIREDMADIRFTCDGVPYGDSWHSVAGAKLEGTDEKTRPGGMGMEVAIGGPAKRTDATLKTQLTDAVLAFHKTLEQKVVEAAPIKLAITYLDRLKAPTGQSQVYTGVIRSAALPDMNTDASTAGMYTVILTMDEQAA